ALPLMTMPSSLSALSLHPIFGPAVNLMSFSGQSLTSSSAVSLFAVNLLISNFLQTLADSSYKALSVVSVFYSL
ncbi:uncharacterized protein BDCG_17658, partial [Blastomyces dermatitidis ER-3]